MPDRAHIEHLLGPGVELAQFDMGGPSIGVWDQVLKLGRFVKSGVVSVFDDKSIGQMLDNWAGQKNDLWLDRGHDMDKALAYYNALAFVVGGKVVRYEPHDGAPAAPSLFDLQRGRKPGWAPPDGLYAHRYQVTPLGADDAAGLRAYKYASPAFSKSGRDEQGKDIGYVLYNVAATNIPFLDDVTLAMSKGDEVSAMADKKPDELMDDKDEKQCMEEAGVKDEDSPDDKMKKMRKYAASMRGKMRKMEDEAAKKDKPPGDDDKEKMAREVLVSIGLPGDPDMARGKIETFARGAAQAETLRAELDAIKANLAREQAAKVDADAQRFAKDAIDQRRWDPEHKGDPEKTQAWLVEQYKKSPADAEGMLHAPGKFGLTRDGLRETFTKGGAPRDGGGAPQGSGNGQGHGAELNRAAWKLVADAKAKGQEITYSKALELAEKNNPELVQRYERAVLAAAG